MTKCLAAAAIGGMCDGLDDHVATFLGTLADVRYQRKTREDKRRVLEPFLRWVRAERLAPSDLDESRVATYLRRVSGCRHERGHSEPATLRQFLGYLRTAGVVRPGRDPSSSPADALVGRYVDYLRNGRGLSLHSVAVYTPYVSEFVVALGLGERSPVGAHLRRRGRSRSPPRSCPGSLQRVHEAPGHRAAVVPALPLPSRPSP